MVAEVNFNTHGTELKKARDAVIDEKDNTNWVIYAFDKGTYDLRVQESGDGGLEELCDEFSDSKVQFAYAKVIDPNSELPKFVFICWCGSGVPELRKAFYNSQLSQVSKFLKPFHVQINARDEADVEPELIMKRVGESSGANYSVHKESAKAQSRVTPVNSVYKKTEIPDIAAMQKESMTKENAPKPVGTNYKPVTTTPGKLEQRWNASSNSSDSGANAVRAERERYEQEVRERETTRITATSESTRRQDEAEEADRRKREDSERLQREQELETARVRQQEVDTARQREADERRKEEDRQQQEYAEQENNRRAQEEEEKRRLEATAQEEEERRAQEEEERRAQEEEERRFEAAAQEEEERRARAASQEEEEKRAKAAAQEEEERRTKAAHEEAHNLRPELDKVATVLFEYEASESNEMSLIVGEVIKDIEEVDEGWWFGKSEDGKRQGLFPANYVELLDSPPVPSPPPAPTQSHQQEEQEQHATEPTAQALYDYTAEEENEITFKEGDIISSIEFVSDDWWQGTVNNGNSIGLFPANYVELKE